MHLNVEIKARVKDLTPLRAYLKSCNAIFRGKDHQIDTYYRVPEGRLKLRRGNIENALIFYRRANQAGPKESEVFLHQVPMGQTSLADLLQASLGIDVEVDKIREIYFIENVKFHLDEVKGLGFFAEIEAIDADGTLGVEKLRAQCDYYLKALQIQPEDLLTHSYSDMLRNRP